MEGRPWAKVNLNLEILGRRSDGYHELSSVFMQIGLCDRLTIMLGSGPADRLTVTGLSGASVKDNLVLRALDAVRSHAGASLPPLDISLEKMIPAAAGLGGGSSDAAMALKMAQLAWGLRLAPSDEQAVAESLGSDVPFFYYDMCSAGVSGRGEKVEPWADCISDMGITLVHPPIELSTPAVYARYDELPPRSGDVSRVAWRALWDMFLDQPNGDELVALGGLLRDANDLWPAAASLEPTLPVLREELERATSKPWLMSGSGPTLFALYASVAEAAEAGQALVASRLPSLENALINAVNLVGPDPAWRYP